MPIAPIPTSKILYLKINSNTVNNTKKKKGGFCRINNSGKSFVFVKNKVFCTYLENIDICTHLPVNQAHDSSLHPHSHSETSVHVLMVEEGLQTGEQEHQSGIEVALPQRSVFVSYETQKKTAGEEK